MESRTIPTAFFTPTPASVWPLTTRGPYPPPRIALLKDATMPKTETFHQLNLGLRSDGHGRIVPMATTRIPIHADRNF
ncbi:MAG: hypothetical protein ABIG11_08100 [bacterium]